MLFFSAKSWHKRAESSLNMLFETICRLIHQVLYFFPSHTHQWIHISYPNHYQQYLPANVQKISDQPSCVTSNMSTITHRTDHFPNIFFYCLLHHTPFFHTRHSGASNSFHNSSNASIIICGCSTLWNNMMFISKAIQQMYSDQTRRGNPDLN